MSRSVSTITVARMQHESDEISTIIPEYNTKMTKGHKTIGIFVNKFDKKYL